MTVFIDSALWPAHGTLWAHLVSDSSVAELHAFATAVGLPRRSFDLDHYDVPAERVSELVAAGAVAASGRELVARLTASGLRVRGRDRAAAKRAALLARWSALFPGVRGAREVGDALLTRWHEPHRAYHGPGHLTHVLDSLAVLEVGDPAPRAVHLALWFHDAVHEGQAGTDEVASADLATTLLTTLVGRASAPDRAPDRAQDSAANGTANSAVNSTLDGPEDGGANISGGRPAGPLTAEEIAEVARLVLVTRDHNPAPADLAGALVSDADLAILASAPDRYARYVAQVRTEYSHVPDAAFAAGRAAVLQQLLASAPLFRTSQGAARWEGAAQANLRAELSNLRGEPGR